MKDRQQKLKQRAQKRDRRENREHKEQQHFTEPLTGKRARHVSRAEANMAYGETDRQIKGQIRASAQQQARVGSWYDQFANEIAASRGEVAGAYDKANTAIAGTMQTAAADNTARNAALSAQDAQFAQLTGAPQNTSGPQTDSAAQGQRALYGAALAAPVAAQGANAYAYLTNQKNTARGEGIYQKVQERKRRQSLQQDRKALLKEKGQYRVSKLDELRAREQARADERWKVNKAFPLEKAGLKQDAAQFNATQAQDLRENREDNAQDERASQRSSKPEGKDGLTPSQRRDARREQHNAMTAAKTLYNAAGRPAWGNKEWTLFVQRVALEDGIDYTAAKRAVSRLRAQVGKQGGTGTAQGHVHR